jgi:hypothetical protein
VSTSSESAESSTEGAGSPESLNKAKKGVQNSKIKLTLLLYYREEHKVVCLGAN